MSIDAQDKIVPNHNRASCVEREHVILHAVPDPEVEV